MRDLSLMCCAVFLKEITLQNKTSELHSVLPVIANLQELSTQGFHCLITTGVNNTVRRQPTF